MYWSPANDTLACCRIAGSAPPTLAAERECGVDHAAAG